ncbi:MAG: EAL domain-containing protein [Acidithiobacillus sp.]|nr:EAL domain-containing protein [Acidithiobacillus sp.]
MSKSPESVAPPLPLPNDARQSAVLIEAIPDAAFWKDGAGRWLLINEAAKALFHLEQTPWQGKTDRQLAELHPEFRNAYLACAEDDEKAWQAGEPIVVVEEVTRPDGTPGIFETRKIPVFTTYGKREGLLILGRDITAQKRLEAELRRQVEIQEQLMQYNRLLGNVNEAIARAVTAEKLLQRICELTVTHTRAALVWIAQPDTQEWFQTLAAAGNTGYLQKILASTRADLPEGNGPTGRCWRAQTANFNGLFTPDDPRMAPWQEIARQFGLAASSAIPILRSGQIWGVFTIYLGQEADFTPELRAILKELGRDISFGLDHLDTLERERQLLEEIKAQATTDSLTGLPNRRALDLELERALFRASRRQRLLAACMLDLDGFKPVNDTYGHDVGDQLLIAIGKRLAEVLRGTDFLTRLGGDEFILLFEDLENLSDLPAILDRIVDAVQSPLALGNGQEVQVSLSMGVAIHYGGDPKAGGGELLRLADQAMYQAKEHKQERLKPWLIAGEAPQLRRNKAQELIDQGAVEVWYQPILSLQQSRIVGVEALGRLRDETGEIWPPARFLPQLQKEDLATLTRRVMEQAIRDLSTLDAQGLQLWTSVNMDPSSVSPDCIACVKERLLEGTIDPCRITLEILEGSDFQEQKEAVTDLLELKALGVRLALDDIGSAYSSLLRIKELPIDKIKLDQGFVRTLKERPEDLAFVRSIQGLAQGLGVDLVVEGVETASIQDALRALGVDLLQGYAIAKPMPLEQLQDFLQQPIRLPQDCPSTLLGLYAASLVHHEGIKSAIRLHSRLLNPVILADARSCETAAQLQWLLAADPDTLATLNALHEEVHHQLAQLEAVALSDAGHSLDWTAADGAERAFLQALRDVFHQRQREGRGPE